MMTIDNTTAMAALTAGASSGLDGPSAPCPICAAKYDGYVEAYAKAKGWESPSTWGIYDPRFKGIQQRFADWVSLSTAAQLSESLPS